MDWMRGKRQRGRFSGRIFPDSKCFVHRMSRLKGRHGRSPFDTGTILLDRIGNTDDFSRS